VSGEKGSGRKILKFLFEALWDVTQFQLVKGDIPLEKIVYIFRIEQWKNNGILFKNIGNFACFFEA
jgi:hypothetical protein